MQILFIRIQKSEKKKKKKRRREAMASLGHSRFKIAAAFFFKKGIALRLEFLGQFLVLMAFQCYASVTAQFQHEISLLPGVLLLCVMFSFKILLWRLDWEN